MTRGASSDGQAAVPVPAVPDLRLDPCPQLAVVVGADDGTVRHLTAAWQPLLGGELWRRENTPFLSLLHPDDRDRARQALAEARGGTAVEGLILRLRGRDRTVRSLSCQFSYVAAVQLTLVLARDPADHARIEGTSRQVLLASERLTAEIQERRLKEEALRQSEARFRGLFENCPVPLVEEDCSQLALFIEGRRQAGVTDFRAFFTASPALVMECAGMVRLVDANQAALDFFGADSCDELDHRLGETLGTEAHAVWLDALVAAAQDETVFEREAQVRSLRGAVRHAVLKWAALPSPGTSLGRVLMSITDITERHQAEIERERLFEELLASRARLQALSQRLVQVQESERRAVSRDLHDQIGQALAALALNLRLARSQITTEAGGVLAGHLDESLGLVTETVQSLRQVLTELRPPLLDDLGLGPALERFAEQFARQTGLCAEFASTVSAGARLPADSEIALFRIAQEAMTNAAKHARARTVTVRLEPVQDGLRLSVADDGTGFDPAAVRAEHHANRWGMVTMVERATAIGATLEIESRPGRGTRVAVTIRVVGGGA